MDTNTTTAEIHTKMALAELIPGNHFYVREGQYEFDRLNLSASLFGREALAVPVTLDSRGGLRFVGSVVITTANRIAEDIWEIKGELRYSTGGTKGTLVSLPFTGNVCLGKGKYGGVLLT